MKWFVITEFSKSIVSDRDPFFLSNFWKEIFRLQGMELNMSSDYHPESDGQTEVINRCLKAYLRCFAVDQPHSWASRIPWAEFWYNNTFHGSRVFLHLRLFMVKNLQV